MLAVIILLILLSYIISFFLMRFIIEPLVVWKYSENIDKDFVIDVNNHYDDDDDDDVAYINEDHFIDNDVHDDNKFDDVRDDEINADGATGGENENCANGEDEENDSDVDDENKYDDVVIAIDEDVAIDAYSDLNDDNADAATAAVVAVATDDDDDDDADSDGDIVSGNHDDDIIFIDEDVSIDAYSDYKATATLAAYDDDDDDVDNDDDIGVDCDGNVSDKFRWKVFKYFCCC
ncbi:hypothetical protein MN116_000274 [Schistosoma mekongi]|uniref:Uncharacterized protein n=1 Tax=Schistosoma mekongi TaxID=38744 RepID=A0AAE1Z537_SCHME|nr:hypothetical protein MN116_000274 [Schistosoma mekongi]